jgi:hypothetical protein
MRMLRIPQIGILDVFASVQQTEAGSAPIWPLNRQTETREEVTGMAVKINGRQARSEWTARERMAGL